MITFQSLGHVAIRSPDPDGVARFYSERLGLAEMFRMDDADGCLWLITLRIAGEQFLEIYTSRDEAAGGSAASGWHHVCLTVNDLDETVRALWAAEVEPISDIMTGRTGNRQIWIADPDGNPVEIMEMRADGRQMQAIRAMNG